MKHFEALFWGSLLVVSSVSNGDPGQFRIRQIENKAVAKVAPSVYRIVYLFEKPVETIPREKFEETLREASWFRQRLYQARFHQCTLKDQNPCLIHFAGNICTAFLHDHQSQIASGRHCLIANFNEFLGEEELSAEELRKKLYHYVPRFQLYDAQDQLFYDTRKNEARIAFVVPPEVLAEEVEMVANLAADWIQFDLSKALSQSPIKTAKSIPKVGEQVFLLGYSVPTTGRDRHKAPDANGKGLFVSKGVVSSEREIADIIEGMELPKLKDFNQAMLFSNVDGVHGQSGGPLVNARGEVVAVFTAHFGTEEDGPNARYFDGAAAFAEHIDWLAKLKKDFPAPKTKQAALRRE